jgi:hypothetical protein
VATNWLQNFYIAKKPEKYIGDLTNIVYRSSWEKKLFEFCETNNSIRKWSSEPFPIKYWDESTLKTRRYFTDAYIEVNDINGNIKKYLVEVKPYKQTIEPKRGKKKSKTYINECLVYTKNQSKWKFAREFCERNGMEFIIITEKELNLPQR